VMMRCAFCFLLGPFFLSGFSLLLITFPLLYRLHYFTALVHFLFVIF
jgi:hypothetical protein